MRRVALISVFALALVLPLVAQPSAQQTPLQTPAERVNFQQGGTLYDPLMQFVYDLEARSPLMHVQKLTQTLLGRDVVLCILYNPPVFRPEDVDRKSVV